jgi:hypothetical protein
MANRIEMYKDPTGHWRWRVRSGNNQTVAASEQGYRNYYYALLKAKISGGLTADVKILEPPDPKPPTPDPESPESSAT